MVAAQLSEVVADLPPRAIKTGALGSPAIIEQVAHHLSRLQAPLVVDPVMASSRGGDLLQGDGIHALRQHLLPLATLLTPNLPEAAALTGGPVDGPEAMEQAARDLCARGPRAVLIKGGHGGGDEVADLLLCDEELIWIRSPRVAGPAPHGTGCVLSAAITAHLAKGHSVPEAVILAHRLVLSAIKGAHQLGAGQPFLAIGNPQDSGP
jgi:hydroxymethylpyrimidine/phosphomethylpyrimidine kinase